MWVVVKAGVRKLQVSVQHICVFHLFETASLGKASSLSFQWGSQGGNNGQSGLMAIITGGTPASGPARNTEIDLVCQPGSGTVPVFPTTFFKQF